MNLFIRISDQLYNWSEKNGKSIDKFAPASRESHSTASSNEAGIFKGVVDRAIQEVWEAWLQMRERSGAWAEILSLGKHAQKSSGDDLRAAGLCRSSPELSFESSRSSRAVGGDLRNQPRTVEESREVLESSHEFGVSQCLGNRRRFGGRGVGRQYDTGLSLCGIGTGGGDR